MHEGQLAPVFAVQPFSRIPAYDPVERKHFFVTSALWWVDVTQEIGLLDQENMVSLMGPFCYHCEEHIEMVEDLRVCPGDPRT